MKKKLLKFICLSLVFSMLTSNFVFASSNYVNSVGSVSSDIHNHEENIVGIDYNQTQKSEYSDELTNFDDNETKVYATKASSFSVVIPKKVILDGGETNKGDYSVKVKGDIASNDVVEVIPDYSFNFNQKGKDSIPAKVSQDKITFKIGDEGITESNILTGVTTIGTISVNEISAGSWIGTFKFNIGLNSFSKISVNAVDENGVNLNATSNDIVGTEKEVLLDALEETGFVEDSSEVDALIEVKSDDFDNIADTTFDVSSIAEEGDTVVILHFDEETGEWEYVGTETVTDGKVSGDFTSYSPIAFIVVKDNHTHNYERTTIKEANCTEKGEFRFDCECGSFYTQDIKALGHDFSDDYIIDKNVSCIEVGSKSQHCSRCSATQNVTVIPATGHKYGTPTYIWSDDLSTCTATRVCSNDSSHKETETVNSTSTITTNSTCTANGVKTYTATFANSAFVKQTKTKAISSTGHTEVIDNAVAATCTTSGKTEGKHCLVCNAVIVAQQTIPAVGHKYGTPTYTWTSDLSKCTATRICSNNSVHKETETVSSTNAVTKAATCTATGTRTYTATFTNSAFAKQTKTQSIAALGHNTNGNEDDNNYYCSVCGYATAKATNILTISGASNKVVDAAHGKSYKLQINSTLDTINIQLKHNDDLCGKATTLNKGSSVYIHGLTFSWSGNYITITGNNDKVCNQGLLAIRYYLYSGGKGTKYKKTVTADNFICSPPMVTSNAGSFNNTSNNNKVIYWFNAGTTNGSNNVPWVNAQSQSTQIFKNNSGTTITVKIYYKGSTNLECFKTLRDGTIIEEIELKNLNENTWQSRDVTLDSWQGLYFDSTTKWDSGGVDHVVSAIW